MKYYKYLKYKIFSLGNYIKNLEANQKEERLPFGVTGMLVWRDGEKELIGIIKDLKKIAIVCLVIGAIAGFVLGVVL